MGDGTIETVLTTSILGTLRVFAVLLVGFLASKWPKHEPLLTKGTCRCVSRLCALLFMPALMISSIGSTLSPKALLESWQLVVVASFTILVSGATAWTLSRVILGREDRRAFRPVQLAITFHNAGSVPLLLMGALCEQEDVRSDFGDDADECFLQATSTIFLYVAVWQIWFYTWGFYALSNEKALELKIMGQPNTSTMRIAGANAAPPSSADVAGQEQGSLNDGDTQSTMGMDVVAIDVTANDDMEELRARSNGSCTVDTTNDERGGEYRDYITEARAVSQGEAVPRAPVLTGEQPSYAQAQTKLSTADEAERRNMPRTNGTFPARTSAHDERAKAELSSSTGNGNPKTGWAGAKKRTLDVLVSPNIIAVTIGLVIAMIAPLQEMLFDNSQAALRPLGAALEMVGTPMVAVSTLVMAGSLAQVPTVEASPTHGGEQGGTLRDLRRFRFVMAFFHIMCRLVVVPAIGFTLIWLATTHTSLMGENRLMHLILLIELGMPSAALVIVTLNQQKLPATAGFMARLYLWQYGVSMFTISGWTALAVRMVY